MAPETKDLEIKPSIRESFRPYGQPPQEPEFAEIDSLGPYPADPLLSISEIGENPPDLRSRLPVETQNQLSKDEIVVRINDVDVSKNLSPPSAIKILMALTGVNSMADIGENGPSIAALPGSADIYDAAQNRFVAPHVRDAILTAKLTRTAYGPNGEPTLRLAFPELMRSTLVYAAEEGGIIDESFDPNQPYRQEKPGKVMLVDFGLKDPGGRKFGRYLGWGFPIYTSVDAGPLFISNLADYVTHEEPGFLSAMYRARDGQEHPMAQFLDTAVDRLMTDLEESKQGFLEFKNLDPRDGMGMINQAWADSSGAYVHADGSWANHNSGIAAVEVQGYAYDALIKAAELYRQKFNEPDKAKLLEDRAEKLQADVLANFFITDARGTYAAMARDYDEHGQARNLAVRHANMGLLLDTKLLDGDDPEIVSKRQAIIETLFSEGMVTKYGFRTLDKNEKAYRPGGDHVGQIWPHLNERIARGLIKHGCHELAGFLRRGNWLTYMETHALPEYIRGDSEEKVSENPQQIFVWNKRHRRLYIFETPGQRSQAWATEAVLAAKFDYQPLKGTPSRTVSEFESGIIADLPKQELKPRQ